VDDYYKDVKKISNGLLIREKLIFQIILGLLVGFFLYFLAPSKNLRGITESLFLKNLIINLGIFYIPAVAVVLVGTINAINIVDGLDGLAGGLTAIVAGVFVAVSYISGRRDFANYLAIFYLPGASELSIFASALTGGILGFLWYNTYPAQIFLGDTGSLAIGGAISSMAVLLKKELLLFILGGVFVVETLTVIIQIISFRCFGKRVFKIAPIHHSFELDGMAEPKIVVRFWIVGILFALFGLGTFKLR
jgi:phospho-N-acetylmuramoyl-pentapeptide-transferase